MRCSRVLAASALAATAAAARPSAGPEASPAAPFVAKKQILRAEKAVERASGPRGRVSVVTLVNHKTRERLPVAEGAPPTEDEASLFLRCHFTGERAWMAPLLLDLAVAAARRFESDRVEIVSGYRSRKYNRLLRKKGHEVARHSHHMRGDALDFRVPGAGMRELRRFVLGQGAFGIGIYPHSGFVHVDVGPPRSWGGR